MCLITARSSGFQLAGVDCTFNMPTNLSPWNECTSLMNRMQEFPLSQTKAISFFPGWIISTSIPAGWLNDALDAIAGDWCAGPKTKKRKTKLSWLAMQILHRCVVLAIAPYTMFHVQRYNVAWSYINDTVTCNMNCCCSVLKLFVRNAGIFILWSLLMTT